MSMLYPVIKAVPAFFSGLPRAERQPALSRLARRPLAVSARKTGVSLPAVLEKNRLGAPLPAGGLWWSVTHKPDFVAGIVSFGKIGIDIEKIAPVSPSLLKKIADPEEQGLFDSDTQTMLFRCWTAKEAVLKAAGKGLSGLGRCRVANVQSDTRLIVTYDKTRWLVEQYHFCGHLAAVTSGTDDRVHWTLLDEEDNEIKAKG